MRVSNTFKTLTFTSALVLALSVPAHAGSHQEAMDEAKTMATDMAKEKATDMAKEKMSDAMSSDMAKDAAMDMAKDKMMTGDSTTKIATDKAKDMAMETAKTEAMSMVASGVTMDEMKVMDGYSTFKTHWSAMDGMPDDQRTVYWAAMSEADQINYKKFKTMKKAMSNSDGKGMTMSTDAKMDMKAKVEPGGQETYMMHKAKMKTMSDGDRQVYWNSLSNVEQMNYKDQATLAAGGTVASRAGAGGMMKKHGNSDANEGASEMGNPSNRLVKAKDSEIPEIMQKKSMGIKDEMRTNGKVTSKVLVPRGEKHMMKKATMEKDMEMSTKPTMTLPETQMSFDEAVQYCLQNSSEALQACVDMATGQR